MIDDVPVRMNGVPRERRHLPLLRTIGLDLEEVPDCTFFRLVIKDKELFLSKIKRITDAWYQNFSFDPDQIIFEFDAVGRSMYSRHDMVRLEAKVPFSPITHFIYGMRRGNMDSVTVPHYLTCDSDKLTEDQNKYMIVHDGFVLSRLDTDCCIRMKKRELRIKDSSGMHIRIKDPGARDCASIINMMQRYSMDRYINFFRTRT